MEVEAVLLEVTVDHADVWRRGSNRMGRFFPVAMAAVLGNRFPTAQAHAGV